MNKFVSCLCLSLVIFVLPTGIAYSISGIEVQRNEVIQDFPDGISFALETSSSMQIEKVVLVYGTDGRTCQSGAAHQQVDIESGTSLAVVWEWDWRRSGILPPGTKVWWQWEITDENGQVHQTPELSVAVEDVRHDWQRLSDNGMHLQWHTGDNKFGQDLLKIVMNGLDKLQRDLGIRPEETIHITVYPSSEELRETLLVAQDWTGGVAFPDHFSMMIAIHPTELGWAADLIPHELNHLVVDSIIFNCRGVWLPTWLSEGLAEQSEGEPTQRQIDFVVEALKDGTLPTLVYLERGFSAYGDEAHLSYMQSKLVVYYLIQEYGAEKMVETLETLQAGNDVDQALVQVYGFDTCGLDAAWRISMGYASTVSPSCEDQTAQTPTPVPTLALVALDLPATATPSPPPVIVLATPTVEPSSTPTVSRFKSSSTPLNPGATRIASDQNPIQNSVPSSVWDSGWVFALLVASIVGGLILLFKFVLFIRRR